MISYVIPKEDIKKLEEAREALWKSPVFDGVIETITLLNITAPLWKITHKKYPKIIDNNEEQYEFTN